MLPAGDLLSWCMLVLRRTSKSVRGKAFPGVQEVYSSYSEVWEGIGSMCHRIRAAGAQSRLADS